MRKNTLFSLSNPAIRHLAWLCTAPQLLQCPLSFTPQRYLPEDYFAILTRWDSHFQSAPALLQQPPQARLGHYVERLYRVMLEDLSGWEILLQNQQIHSNGRTIGELDFVVYNPIEQRVEHHEIAIKFYLGHSTHWFGPNAHDRLDLKTASLLSQQSQRARTPEALALLADHGIFTQPEARIFMPGYLFYPSDSRIATTPEKRSAALSYYVPNNHLKGLWAYAHQLNPADCTNWAILRKPHWLGPWQQTQPPCPQQVSEALEQIQHQQSSRLFVNLQKDAETGQWRETGRCFVMPSSWPR